MKCTPKHPGQREPVSLYQWLLARMQLSKPHAPSPAMPLRWHLQRVSKSFHWGNSGTCQGRCQMQEGCDWVTCSLVRGVVETPGWVSTAPRGHKELPQLLTPTRVCALHSPSRAGESRAAATRVSRGSASVPPTLCSPEAGGELARGFQAGVPGGGDFVLGANLPARRGVGTFF